MRCIPYWSLKSPTAFRYMIKLSIVILNYNTRGLLRDCLDSLEKVKGEVRFEVIVCDNGSTDESLTFIKNSKFQIPNIKFIENGENLGFARGNNAARNVALGEYILFLNSDTVVYKDTLRKTVLYLDEHKDVGALTCKALLSDGSFDKDTRRSFITPWIGFVHLFLRLDRIFPKSKLFSQYWYGYIDENKVHEVDAIQGAFFMTRKKILDEVGWFDEDYFLDAEDIDLSWKIKHAGGKNIYYPKVSILHLKGATKGKNRKLKSSVSLKEKLKYRLSGVNSMEIFYRKRMWNQYPFFINYLVLWGISVLKMVRATKVIVFG
jgi:GT2 family glycosyltransferase